MLEEFEPSGNRPPGLFITGTDTGVGKTYIAALIAQQLVADGLRVGVYKPVASGCVKLGEKITSEDAPVLWDAAGRPGELERVCPQCFEAPLVPNVAASAEGRSVDSELLVTGIDYWSERSDIVLVEGVGGIFSPMSENMLTFDLADVLGFPLLIVARNALGTINHTLMTLQVLAEPSDMLDVAGVVFNRGPKTSGPIDPSQKTNRRELGRWSRAPVLADVKSGATSFGRRIDWYSLADVE